MSLVLNLVGRGGIVVVTDTRLTLSDKSGVRLSDTACKSFSVNGFIVSMCGERTTDRGETVFDWLFDLAKNHTDPASFPTVVLESSAADARLSERNAVIFVAYYLDGKPRVYRVDTATKEIRLRLKGAGASWDGDHLNVVEAMIYEGIDWGTQELTATVDLGRSVMDAVVAVSRHKRSQSVGGDVDVLVLRPNSDLIVFDRSLASFIWQRDHPAIAMDITQSADKKKDGDQ